MRPKRPKRPKGGLLSLLSLWSLLLLDSRASRMARYLPIGLPSRRKPDLDRPAPGGPAFRLGAPPRHQQSERGADAVGRAVPAEQVADRSPGDALRAGALERTRNLVGNRVAQEVAKDESGRRLAILPDRQRSLEVRHVDLPRPVEQRVDQRQPDHLSLATGDHGPKQSRLSRRELAVDRLPLLPRAGCHRDATNALGVINPLAQPFAQLERHAVIERATKRQFFRPPDEWKEEPIRKSIGGLGAGEAGA